MQSVSVHIRPACPLNGLCKPCARSPLTRLRDWLRPTRLGMPLQSESCPPGELDKLGVAALM